MIFLTTIRIRGSQNSVSTSTYTVPKHYGYCTTVVRLLHYCSKIAASFERKTTSNTGAESSHSVIDYARK